MNVDTMARLFELKNIVGVKDATGDLNRVDQQRKKMGSDFIQLSGEDGTALEFNTRGGVGCISVTANIVPKLIKQICDHSLNGDFKQAKTIDLTLTDLHEALFLETSPIPVKWALNKLGRIPQGIRLPLTWLDNEYNSQMELILKKLGLIN